MIAQSGLEKTAAARKMRTSHSTAPARDSLGWKIQSGLIMCQKIGRCRIVVNNGVD
jgi:hypothetical protein